MGGLWCALLCCSQRIGCARRKSGGLWGGLWVASCLRCDAQKKLGGWFVGICMYSYLTGRFPTYFRITSVTYGSCLFPNVRHQVLRGWSAARQHPVHAAAATAHLPIAAQRHCGVEWQPFAAVLCGVHVRTDGRRPRHWRTQGIEGHRVRGDGGASADARRHLDVCAGHLGGRCAVAGSFVGVDFD